MISKNADDKSAHVEALEALLNRKDLDATQKRNIERDLRFMRAGMRGEKDAAYEVDFYYGKGQNWCVLHDLRIEHEGRVAQIDHLLLNRLMEAFVLETKNFSEGVGCNEHGEFVQFWNGKAQGIASPVEQNAKHIDVLKAALRDGRVPVPKRLGITLMPHFIGLVVVSKTARISRPKGNHPELDCLLKMDQLSTRLDKQLEKANLLKLIGQDTLHEFAQSIAQMHVPASLPTAARYGLAETAPVPTQPAPPTAQPKEARSRGWRRAKAAEITGAERSTAVAEAAQSEESAEGAPKSSSKLRCKKCEAGVPFAVAKFCWQNKKKFGGDVYCREHQADFA